MEDLLDIEIFSLMNDVLSSKRTDNKTQVTDTRHELDLVNQSISIKEGHIEKIKVQQGEKIKTEKANLEKEVKNLEDQRNVQEKLSIGTCRSKLQRERRRVDSINDLIYQLKTNAKKYKKEYDFFENILNVQRVPNISPMKYETLRRLMQKTNEQSVITPSTRTGGSKQSAIQTILDRCADLSDKIKKEGFRDRTVQEDYFSVHQTYC